MHRGHIYTYTHTHTYIYDDAENITNGSHSTHDSKRTCTTRTIERKTFREHRCGAGQTLSEGQVRILLTTLEC